MNQEILKSLVGKVVKVNRGGHDSRVGKLLGVEEDYFVLLTKEDGVLYFKSHHVKSLTDNTKKAFEFSLSVPRGFTYTGGKVFTEVMNNLKYNWVTINRGGHEKYQGVLHDINDDYVTVIFNEEVIRVSTFHIKNISYDLKIEDSEKERKQTNDQRKNVESDKKGSDKKDQGEEELKTESK
jgi:spore coat protein B